MGDEPPDQILITFVNQTGNMESYLPVYRITTIPPVSYC
ncbi:hypothetical protein VCHA36O157_40079 [Vibrio chagasii]|nr:hypothetical protein VCHA34P115_40081 [Vibrio chagasii]CAH6948118.1 hypothetical protein VCHA36O157_40079 [Vibrio chagasii]CAH6954751.1 hypothetical protein VCHA35P150_30272 [Vibrio chagasii]CAH7274752.1 hypothetical protein VCHA41O245_190079 [Vibrio chagasii]